MPELSTLADVIAKVVEPYDESQPAVLSRSIALPPTAAVGDRYIVPTGARDAWLNHTREIAEWTTAGWVFTTVAVGTSTWVVDERLSLYFDGTDWIHEGGGSTTVAGGVLAHANKRMPARTTFSDGDLGCDIALAGVPAGSISVMVNGIGIPELGNGTKVGAACYFSIDGSVALQLSSLGPGVRLYWNGSVAGYELDAGDIVEFVYEIA